MSRPPTRTRNLRTALVATAVGAVAVAGAIAPATAATPPAKGKIGVQIQHSYNTVNCTAPASPSTAPINFSSTTARRTVDASYFGTTTDPGDPTDRTKTKIESLARGQLKARNGSFTSFDFHGEGLVRMNSSKGADSDCDVNAQAGAIVMATIKVKRKGKLVIEWDRARGSVAQFVLVKGGSLTLGPDADAEVNVSAGGPSQGRIVHNAPAGTYTLQLTYIVGVSDETLPASTTRLRTSEIDLGVTWTR